MKFGWQTWLVLGLVTFVGLMIALVPYACSL